MCEQGEISPDDINFASTQREDFLFQTENPARAYL